MKKNPNDKNLPLTNCYPTLLLGEWKRVCGCKRYLPIFILRFCCVPRYVNFHILFPHSHKKFFFLKGKRCKSINHYFFVRFFVPWAQGAWNIKWCEPSYRLDVDIVDFFCCFNILKAKLLGLWVSLIVRNGDKIYIFACFGAILARLLECLSTPIGTWWLKEHKWT